MKEDRPRPLADTFVLFYRFYRTNFRVSFTSRSNVDKIIELAQMLTCPVAFKPSEVVTWCVASFCWSPQRWMIVHQCWKQADFLLFWSKQENSDEFCCRNSVVALIWDGSDKREKVMAATQRSKVTNGRKHEATVGVKAGLNKSDTVIF